jgi:hypothetical protein
MPLLPPLVLEVGSGPQVPTFRNSTYLDPQVGLVRNLGARQKGLGVINVAPNWGFAKVAMKARLLDSFTR